MCRNPRNNRQLLYARHRIRRAPGGPAAGEEERRRLGDEDEDRDLSSGGGAVSVTPAASIPN